MVHFILPLLALSAAASAARCGADFDNKSCPSNLCCSSAGYCGTGADYCQVPQACQRSFGRCDSDVVPTGYNSTADARPFERALDKPITACSNRKSVALTYDDGPTQYTDELLDVLKEFDAKATFFIGGILNGRGLIDDNWRPQIQRMNNEGHQIASHSFSHPNFDKVPSWYRRLELTKLETSLVNIIGKYPRFLRAPYNICNEDCQKDVKDLGYYQVISDIDSGDWSGSSLDEMKRNFDGTLAQRLTADTQLMLIQHETIRPSAVDLTRHVLQRINTTVGWKTSTVASCLNLQPYRIPTASKRVTSDGPRTLVSLPGWFEKMLAVSALLSMLALWLGLALALKALLNKRKRNNATKP